MPATVSQTAFIRFGQDGCMECGEGILSETVVPEDMLSKTLESIQERSAQLERNRGGGGDERVEAGHPGGEEQESRG